MYIFMSHVYFINVINTLCWPQFNDKGGYSMSNNSVSQELTELPQTGLLRIKQVLRFVPVSRSNWWGGVKTGKYPKPMKLSERVTVWKASDIRDLIEGTPSIDKAIRKEVPRAETNL
jgi:prophage regulatory protein